MDYPEHNPLWATDDTVTVEGTPNKIRPTPELRQFGYAPNSFPTAEELNWQLNNIYNQIIAVKSQIVAPSEFPIGFVMTLTGDTRNPSEIVGYGTWSRFAEGRVIIGAGTTTDVNTTVQTFTDGSSGGEFTHKITDNEMPVHGHSGGLSGPSGGSAAKVEGYVQGAPNSDNYVPTSTGQAGGGQAHNNVQPYVVCFMWRRTA
jgi:hypothetical protein